MAYDITDNAKLGQLKSGLQAAKNYSDDKYTAATQYVDTKISALPKEQFLDLVNTKLVDSFEYSAAKYPGTDNPNFDGKPVLVLALKSVDHTNNDAVTIAYQFISVDSLTNNKAEKAANPTAGHILVSDANGNPVDSGIKFATDAEVTEMINEVFGITPDGD